MSCQCHQIGGPFIAEDPDCFEHGRAAQAREAHRDEIIRQIEQALRTEDAMYETLLHTLEYLQSL